MSTNATVEAGATRTGDTHTKERSKNSVAASESGEQRSTTKRATRGDSSKAAGKKTDTDATLAASTGARLPVVYTSLSSESSEYKKRRERQYQRGLRTLLRAVTLFGGLLGIWVLLEYFVWH